MSMRMRVSLVMLPVALWMAFAGGPAQAEGPDEARRLREMPRLKGAPIERAEQLGRLAGLELHTGVFYIAPRHWRDDIQPRTVYLQTPQPEALVRRGSPVAVWTLAPAAQEQAIVETPDFRGQACGEAAAALEMLGLKLSRASVDPAEDEPANEGMVVDQYPRPGQKVYAGTSVYLIFDDRPPFRRTGPG